jgi:hypothetical protein
MIQFSERGEREKKRRRKQNRTEGKEKRKRVWIWWLMPVIPATWEAKIGRLQFEAIPKK